MSTIPRAGLSPDPEAAPRKYVRAVGPKLRNLLYLVFALVALLCANSAYLGGVTALKFLTGRVYEDYFYMWAFLVHLVLGLLLIVPLVVFGIIHLSNSRNRRNRRAVRMGYALFVISLLVLFSGLVLVRLFENLQLKDELSRNVVYWLHVGSPFAAAWLYWLHRLSGPRIKWGVGLKFGLAAGAMVGIMLALQAQDPRRWNEIGPNSGVEYFEPSLTRTSTGKFIRADVLMMDRYCLKCHADAYDGWFHSAHHFSSFNNPAYFFSVRQTMEVVKQRDGTVQASRWCAGCHDPVPFLSGQFDQDDYDRVNDPTASAGITCTACHAITHVNSTVGNGDYTIEEPIHYPFAQSENPVLQFINNQLVKAKPEFHKQTFLKPFMRSAEFCSVCHKVGIPGAVNKYKEFLRGQNHYDPFLLSGVGHGARSFYYPEKAQANCAGCHMPLAKSEDFGARNFDGSGESSIHNHAFLGANTALPHWKEGPAHLAAHQAFLQDTARVDIFGIKPGGGIDNEIIAPLRPTVPALVPGRKYLLETVIRTLKIGHQLTQGTTDSNELWLEVTLTSGGRVIGKSGGLNEDREVDPWSHFVNVFMLDRHGRRIDRRNAQDIFTPLYNHQIPPGAGQVVHFAFELPPDVREPVSVELKLNYRKFDKKYMDHVTADLRPGDHDLPGYVRGQKYLNDLPIVVMASDQLTFPVEGGAATPVENAERKIPAWQRWNDYGIGLLLEGQQGGPGQPGSQKGEWRQAEHAFLQVEKLGRFDGPLNLARVYFAEGQLDEAVAAVERAKNEHGKSPEDPPPPRWTASWLTGIVNRQQGNLEAARQNLAAVLADKSAADRGFDFGKDYEVINDLGLTFFDLAKVETEANLARPSLLAAVDQFESTLAIDAENVTAHHNLHQLYKRLGDAEQAERHRVLHLRYKLDDNARDQAVNAARARYPAASFAAEAIVVYPLQRVGGYGLLPEAGLPNEQIDAAVRRAAELEAAEKAREGEPNPADTATESAESADLARAEASPQPAASRSGATP